MEQTCVGLATTSKHTQCRKWLEASSIRQEELSCSRGDLSSERIEMLYLIINLNANNFGLKLSFAIFKVERQCILNNTKILTFGKAISRTDDTNSLYTANSYCSQQIIEHSMTSRVATNAHFQLVRWRCQSMTIVCGLLLSEFRRRDPVIKNKKLNNILAYKTHFKSFNKFVIKYQYQTRSSSLSKRNKIESTKSKP